MRTHLVISNANELIRLPARQILYVSSDGNYSTIYQVGGEARLVALQLGEVASLIRTQLPELGANFGRVVIVETEYRESFHDFAEALVDLGVDNAIYLVGSASHGWAHDLKGNTYYVGNTDATSFKNANYIYFR